MTTETSKDPKDKVEDLVKIAIKEALDKRKIAKEAEAISTARFESSSEDTTKEGFTDIITSSTTKSKKIKDNQMYLSAVINNKMIPVEDDFPVTIFSFDDWDERIREFIPNVDSSYVINEKHASDILLAWELNEKVLCYGPTGAGKSSLIKQLCALTCRPFIRVNCTGDMDSSQIFGQLTAKDGSTVWVDGSVTEAVRYGAVFAWDEWDVTPPEISMGLQWLLEDDGKLFLKEMPGSSMDRMITPHKDFRLVAIGNTQGQGDDTGAHAGTNVQNSATLDRFGTAVYIDYLPSATEEKMILNKWNEHLTAKTTKELVKLANLLRQGYKAGQLNLTMSPRALFSICKKLAAGRTLTNAFASVYLNKLNDTQRKVADELFIKVFGK